MEAGLIGEGAKIVESANEGVGTLLVEELRAEEERAEEERLQAVLATHLLDTLPERSFDDLVNLAAVICDAPISLVTLLDKDRQWFKAKVGVDITETPRSDAFCGHAILQEDLFVVPDATLDRRFAANPLVVSAPGIRFYAGMPIKGPDGHKLGTLCVIDVVPRELNPKQREMLTMLALQVSAQVQIRSQMHRLTQVIDEKQRVETKLRESELLFRAFMDHSPLVSFMKDGDGRMLYYNRMFADRFAIDQTEWLGKTDAELWPADFAAAFRVADLAVLERGELLVTEEISPTPGGKVVLWRTYKFPFVGANGVKLLAGMSLDVSTEKAAARELAQAHQELQRVNAELLEMSLTDSLTGLRNRRSFDEMLGAMFAAERRRGGAMSMLLFDVDHFKRVNDTFGHEQGDVILRKVARVLAGCCRAGDMIARYGGEEFAALLPDTGMSGALYLAERFRQAIALADWGSQVLTVSVGVSSTFSGAETAVDLVREADLALYRAKEEGRDRVAGWGAGLVAPGGLPAANNLPEGARAG